jgi:hypothetical protein
MTPNFLRSNLRRAVAVLSVALVAVTTVAVAPDRADAQEPRELVQTKTLDNGLEVIVLSDPSLPIVTIEVAVKNGAFTEPPEFNGPARIETDANVGGFFYRPLLPVKNQGKVWKIDPLLGSHTNATAQLSRAVLRQK